MKKAISAEEFNKTKKELDDTKANLQKVSGELEAAKNRSVSERRAALIARGVPEEEIKGASEAELTFLEKALGSIKPKPDMAGGGGSGVLKGSPLELAQRAYSQKK